MKKQINDYGDYVEENTLPEDEAREFKERKLFQEQFE